MKDSWCSPTIADNGTQVYGGAARNVRLKAIGGCDNLIRRVAMKTLEEANALIGKKPSASDRKIVPLVPRAKRKTN